MNSENTYRYFAASTAFQLRVKSEKQGKFCQQSASAAR